MKPNERLIVALDVDTKEKAIAIVKTLKSDVKIFKVGSELFTSCGPEIVGEVKKNGCEVFLDLKFHDIPHTTARAAAAASRLGVFMLNVHALGGIDMMKKAAEAARDEAKRAKQNQPKIIAVTILTSMDENSLEKIGINDNMETQVLRLARIAKDAGLDGVVASPSEVKIIRRDFGGDFLIVTPGVRSSDAAANDPSAGSGFNPGHIKGSKDDQKRIATPKETVDNGADFIVVGRPIIEAPDPLLTVKKILEEIK